MITKDNVAEQGNERLSIYMSTMPDGHILKTWEYSMWIKDNMKCAYERSTEFKTNRFWGVKTNSFGEYLLTDSDRFNDFLKRKYMPTCKCNYSGDHTDECMKWKATGLLPEDAVEKYGPECVRYNDYQGMLEVYCKAKG